MTELNIGTTALVKLQTELERLDVDIPDEKPEKPEGMDPEHWMHESGLERVLYQLANVCPVCGEIECNENINYIGANPIHESAHPEVRAERARERRSGRHLR